MEDSDKTQSVSSGQNTHPQDTKRTTQPAVKGFHSPLDEGTHKSNPLPEGVGTKYQDKLKDDSDEEMRVTGEELDEEFLQSKNEETQHAHSNKTPTEDPISTEHQSPLPNKDHPESAKDKKTDALDSESSSWDKDDMITEEHVSKTADAEKEPEQEPQDTEPIPITIVMPIVTSTKTEIIGYLSRPQLTDPILEVQVPQPENPSHTTPKLDRGKGIARELMNLPYKPFPELIKVIHEVTKEARVDPKALQSLKGDQEFIKKQDAKIKVLNKEHSKKVMKEKELWKKRIDQYRTSRRNLMFKPFDLRLGCNCCGMNWEPIVPKKRFKVVEDLMTSFQKKYERLRVIPGDGINPSLPAPKKSPSLSIGRKRKA
ncbi:hypothetical protein Tco_0363055 [Tanacetum coccineum]